MLPIKNRIFGNSTANAYAHETSIIYAMHAWWGQSPPDASKIQAASGSAIYYDPWLTSDPGTAFRLAPDPAPPVLVPTLNVMASSTAETNDRRSLLIRALEHRFAGRSQEAIALYKSLLIDALHSDEAMFALIEMGNVYREVRDNGVLGYIESLSKAVNRFRATALQILSNCYRVDGNLAQALAVNNTLISDFAGTAHEKHGRLNQFFINYYNSKQYRQAREQLTTLRARYPDEEMVAVAAWLMEVADGETQPSARQQQATQTTESSASASGGQVSLVAYPNPFNPSTQFAFRLDKAGHVSLRVFDILGRKVAVLLNEEKEPGMYRATWNASNMPSGLYFARLESGGTAMMQKVLLLR
jgi:tetratricopeptide (TPR) repeat protein